jgi:hypothetical protein
MFAPERHPRFLFTLAAGLTVCLWSVAEARHWHYYDHQVSHGSKVQDRQRKAMTFATAVDEMIRACREEAVDLETTPLDLVLQAVQLTDKQRTILQKVPSAAEEAAEPLYDNCPKEIGAQLSEKIEALDRALELMADSLQSLRSAIAAFYGSLDDEQKAQLVATNLSKSDAPLPRKSTRIHGAAAKDGTDAEQKSTCLQWAGALRSWPARQIEAATALSDFQRASLYELAAAIYRSAGDLAQACPTQNRLTPVSRLEAKENLLRALRQDIQAIQPFAAAFENALNHEQRNGLDATIGTSPDSPQTAGSSVRHSSTRAARRR